MAIYTMNMPYGKYPGQYLPDHWATDYNASIGELLDYGKYTTRATNKAVYQMTNGVDFIIGGSGFTYAGDGVLKGGTIKSLTLVDHAGGATMQTITGLNWSGSSFYTTVNKGDSWYTAEVILSGNDTIKGSAGSDDLFGYAGNDTLIGGAGGDNLMGGRGKDTYDGGTSAGAIDQLNFDDAYTDSKGAKGVVVNMAKGTDIDPWGNHETFKNIERVRGTQFADTITGSKNDDQFRPMGGNDIINGGAGDDMIRYDRDSRRDGNKAVTVDLAAGYGIDGFGNRDKLISVESAYGTAKNDTLNGSSVANTLKGDDGNDKLYGGLGADQLYGGDGKDTFIFKTVKDSAGAVFDTIYDFETGDKIDLHVIDANTKTTGNQAFVFIGTSAFSGHADELRYAKTSTETIIYGDVDGDRKADFVLHLHELVTLKGTDFIL